MHSEVRSTSLNPRVGTRLLLVNAPVMASIGLCIARHPILSLQTADLQTRIVSRLRYEFKEQRNVQAGAVLQLSLACLSFLTAFLPAGPCLRGHPCGGGGFVTSSAWGEAKVGDWAGTEQSGHLHKAFHPAQVQDSPGQDAVCACRMHFSGLPFLPTS